MFMTASPESLERAVQISPSSPDSWNSLAVLRIQQRRYADALECLRRALVLRDDFAQAIGNLGALNEAIGNRFEAERLFERAISICQDLPGVWFNLADVRRHLLKFDGCYEAYQRGLELDPGNHLAHSGLIFAMDSDPKTSAADVLAEKRRWSLRHGLKVSRSSAPRPAGDRVKIGYVSGDFNYHSAACAFSVLIRGHDRNAFHVTCYSSGREDINTILMKEAADCWRDVSTMSDEAVLSLIERDNIDILIDLSGHTAGNRLRVFTAAPALIQAHAIGYLPGNGIPEIEYMLGDADMAGAPANFVERVIPLQTAIHFECGIAPDVVDGPMAKNGFPTFGYVGRWSKVVDETIAAWSGIMAALPQARLYLKDISFGSADARQEVLRRLGIGADRVTFAAQTSRFEHLAAHGEYDVGLDPFYINGGISTAESLWMGVPVITKPTAKTMGRFCASLMRAVGLGDFVCDDYVAGAVAAASNAGRLAEIRRGARAMMQRTTLGNAPLYVASFENSYRNMLAGYGTSGRQKTVRGGLCATR